MRLKKRCRKNKGEEVSEATLKAARFRRPFFILYYFLVGRICIQIRLRWIHARWNVENPSYSKKTTETSPVATR